MADRTQEFLKFTQESILNETSIPSALLPPSSAPSSSGKSPNSNNKKYADNPKTKSAFIEAASEIAKGIQQTSKVLSKLTKLVRRQGLFDDPTEEINNLVYRIKEDLNELNTKCDAAQQYVDLNKKNNNSSNPFSSSSHNNNSQSQSSQASNHSLKVVGSLKTELMNATKDFKNVLEVRSIKIKDQQKRKTELTGSSALALAMTPSTTNAPLKQQFNNNNNGHNSPRDESNTNGQSQSQQPVLNRFNNHLPSPYHQDNNTTNYSSSSSNGSSSTAMTRFNPHNNDIYSNGSSDNNNKYHSSFNMHNNNDQHEEQQLLLAPPPATQLYYEQREQAVSEVEKTIVELGTLFKRLSGMIAEQGEMIERVDEDVENAISNADRAHTILTTMYDNASSNRSLYTKMIAILVFFIIFFVLFLM